MVDGRIGRGGSTIRVPAEATEAVRHIENMAAVSGTDWVRGTAAYVGALVAGGPVAEQRYREAIEFS